jgi:AraC family transcriptional regulator, activator of mtrCDE
MTATLLKQVLVMLLRRSLTSMSSWVERFAPLRDREIARAFSEMTAEPGRAHTVQSLARRAGLSRSTFMARFVATIGRPPMVVLRDLRMRQAARQLTTSNDSVEEIASNAGYESRSSFARAFQKVFATDPSEYRTLHRRR